MKVTDPEGVEIRALRSIVDFTGKEIIEIGCGDGRLTRRYASEAKSVHAIDPNVDDLRIARREVRAKNVRFAAGDITTDPLPDRTYDLAILSYSL